MRNSFQVFISHLTSHLPLSLLTFMILMSADALSLDSLSARAADPTRSNPLELPLLFQSDTPLQIIIRTDIGGILEDKSEDPEYQPGTLLQKLNDESPILFDIKLKARGHSRRTTGICSFPPIKLNLKKGQTPNTIFQGQDKLKLVTHCREDNAYTDLVLREYLIYKTYNILTDKSYKVRLVQVTYMDTELHHPPIVQFGFLIEDDDHLAARMEADIFKEHIWHHDNCHQPTFKILALFQYMIGNTDWWVHTEHNVDLFKRNDGALIPVPFDFDLAGVVNAPYAEPSSKLPIETVRQRFYKGPECSLEEMADVIQLFNDKKDEIFRLYRSFEFLSTRDIRSALKYYDHFYKIINNPKKAAQELNGGEWMGYFMSMR